MARRSKPQLETGGVTIPPAAPVAILTETFEGSPGGMNVALPQNEIQDTEARYIQDGLVDQPGLTRRRGPLTPVSGLPALTRKTSGIVMTLNPAGIDKYAVLNGDNASGYFSVYDDTLSTLTDITWPHSFPNNPAAGQPYRVVDAKAALEGGLWIGVSSAYDSNAPLQSLAFWKGANRANYSTGTISLTRGSASVTGTGTSWSTALAPGMHIFATTDAIAGQQDSYTLAYIGTVLSVQSNTAFTLESVSPYTATAKAYQAQALRGFAPKVTTGRITCDTNSSTVTGGATKFNAQGLSSGTWNMYRASDFSWIGQIKSVQSDISLTLGTASVTANAAVSCADEAYIAMRADSDWTLPTTATVNKVGFLNTVYANRQWYANNGSQFAKTSRVWFSDTTDPEAVDLSPFSGNWIDITSTAGINTPIKALASAYNAMLVFKETETYGIFGSAPSNFSVRKLEDDGALSGMSVQSYGGGVLWAGREGIHYFDGIQATNLTQDKLGDVWKTSIRTFNPNTYRMWSMVNRDHYFLFIENISPNLAVVKGTTSVTPTTWCVVINMQTRAVTMATNMDLRGYIVLPAASGKKVWFVVNDASIGYVMDGEALFNLEGTDAVACDGGTAGPDFFYESKKFDAGDSLRLKRFKMLLLHYLVQGGNILVDTVIGLNNVGQTLTSNFPSSVYTWDTLRTTVSTWDNVKGTYATWDSVVQGVFLPKRVKFQKKSQHLSFRLYQSSSAITRLKIGPFQVVYKVLRPGRV